MSSTRAREAREVFRVASSSSDDDLADLSDEDLDLLLAEEDEDEDEDENDDEDDEETPAVVVRKQPTPQRTTGVSSKATTKPVNDQPPKGTFFLALGITLIATLVVFATRVARRKRDPSLPKRADTPMPSLAVDGGTAASGKAAVSQEKTSNGKSPLGKGKEAPPKRCASCGATSPKKKNADGSGASKLLRCGGCRSVYYCSSECQRQHRPEHREICVKAAKEATAQVSAPAAQAAAPAARATSHTNAQRAVLPAQQAPLAAQEAPLADEDHMHTASASETDSNAKRHFNSLRARLGAATAQFWRGGTGPAVSDLQDIAMEANELQLRHGLGRDVECEALRMAGHGMIRMRAFEPAERCLNMCLAVANEGKKDAKPLPPGAEIGAFVALGTLDSSKTPPDLERAKEWYAQAMGIAREAKDLAAEASVCQNLAGVAQKMGDGFGAAEFAEAALQLRRRRVEEAKADLDSTEMALSAFNGGEVASEGPPTSPTGNQPPGAGTITSAEHADTFAAHQGSTRAFLEARRGEIAALANVGAALLKVEDSDEIEGSDATANAIDGPNMATRVAAGVARYEEALVSLRRGASGAQDLEMEIGLLLELANAHDNRVGGVDGADRARGMRGTLRDAVRALTGGQREFPNECALCLETMDCESTPLEQHKPVTCLECMHGYHTECIHNWRDGELFKIEGMTGDEKQNALLAPPPRCPDCVKVRAARAAGQTV
jgi:hypothetical protein